MIHSKIIGKISLFGFGEYQRTGVTGQVKLGQLASRFTFPAGAKILSRNLESYGDGNAPTLSLSTGYASVGAAYVPSAAQVEQATAVGTITLAGNAAITVTGAGIVGSPLTISVPVALGDTASVWAEKVKNALLANSAINSVYNVIGSTIYIFFVRDEKTPYGHPNDTTLNIAIANGTCSGITAAPTSTTIVSGAVASGDQWDSVNKEADGTVINYTFTTILAVLIECSSGAFLFTRNGQSTRLAAGQSGFIAASSEQTGFTDDDLLIDTEGAVYHQATITWVGIE
jgi:hypothetical protein